jgi:tRNA(adenine34) deaminase
MKLALEEASEAGKIGEVPIGAILVQQQQEVPHRKSSLSSAGNNSTTTFRILARAGNRVESHYDASAHAELQVLRKGARRSKNWRLLNSTLYSTLEPCPMCLAACQAFRLPTLVYGAPDLRLGAVETHLRLLDIKHPYHNVSNVIKDICKDESAGLLRSFFKRRRKGESKQRFWRLRLLGLVEN